MEYYVGLDVSLRTVAICVVDADGKRIFERSVACEIEDIVECLRGLPTAALHIGFEAGPMSQHLFRGLRAAGFDVVCIPVNGRFPFKADVNASAFNRPTTSHERNSFQCIGKVGCGTFLYPNDA